MKLLTLVVSCIVVAFLSVPLTARPATPQARKDAQVKAFFAHHAKLARTPAGRVALLEIRVRELGAQVRSLASAKAKSQLLSHHPLYAAFMCIHGYEGAWDANTGNGFYGGLQFGWNEWQTYGGKYASRADLASPADQIRAGIAYHAVSGFSPWPNTARYCGLL